MTDYTPTAHEKKWSAFDDYLVSHGFASENPWEDFANSGLGEGGVQMSAWLLKNSRLPANVPEEHSETAHMTNRVMDFMTEVKADGQPLAVSPILHQTALAYIVHAPYHDMYGAEHIVDPIRATSERETDHSLLRTYQGLRVCRSFSRDHVREHVIPAYMGLIKQLDDNLGRLFAWMDETGPRGNTIVAFTSDHGDYMVDVASHPHHGHPRGLGAAGPCVRAGDFDRLLGRGRV